jgi:hypothetical protein
MRKNIFKNFQTVESLRNIRLFQTVKNIFINLKNNGCLAEKSTYNSFQAERCVQQYN